MLLLPNQFPEKPIFLIILYAFSGKPFPLYGDGQKIRNWIYVEDHARGLVKAAPEGADGKTYNIGEHNKKTKLNVVGVACVVLDETVAGHPDSIRTSAELITFVTNRPGHGRRYAINAGKVEEEFGWVPDDTFESAKRKTVAWSLTHDNCCRNVMDGSYQGKRLGGYA